MYIVWKYKIYLVITSKQKEKLPIGSLFFLFLKLVQINYIFPDNIHIFDRLRSTSTPQIGVHWRHYLKSRSNLRIFSNWRPFQVLRSMSDLLLSNRRPFHSKDLYVFLPCHIMDVGKVCTSGKKKKICLFTVTRPTRP